MLAAMGLVIGLSLGQVSAGVESFGLGLFSGGLHAPRVGEWVTYEISGEGRRASFWRIAVVGEERDKAGRDAVWVEVEVGEDPGLIAPLAQMRMLVTKDMSMGSGGVTRLSISQGFEKPQEVGLDALPRFVSPRVQPPPTRGQSAWIRTGERAWVMTAAGSVAATPVDLMHEGTMIRRTWVSAQVPVLHIAKMEMPLLNHAIAVRDYGTQARPKMRAPDASDPKIHLER